MKIFLATITLLISFYILKVDLFEGTIPLAFSTKFEECTETNDFISVEIIADDTIYSLFSIYPTGEPVTFTERLVDFYALNPHLQNQPLVVGDEVLLPVYTAQTTCKKEE